MTMSNLNTLRTDFATRGKWSIGYLGAGALYWTFAAVVGAVASEETARVMWAMGGALIFPIGIAFSYLFGADPFVKGNPLGTLVGIAHASSIWLLMPLVVLFWIWFPAGMPLALAVSLGVSYPVLSWAFGDSVFLWHILVRVGGATAIWFVLPTGRYTALPAFVAVLYFGTLAVVPGRRRRWLEATQATVAV
jgi:hypothetical protein